MGMMTKMRDNAHVFIIAFAVVFVAFWVVSDVDIASVMQGSQNEIASIDGRSISYQEFQAAVDQLAEQRRQQNNNQDLDENAMAAIREEVWNNFVTQAVIDRAIDEMNISVSDEEVVDYIRGPNPPEILARNFRDSTGRFNRENYEQFLQNPGPENLKILPIIEEQIREEMIRTKLTQALSSAVHLGDQELRSKFADENLQLAANYIFFDPRTIAAKDTSAPTDAEYQAYFEKNKEQFKRKEMRKLKYVLFDERPSSSDSAAVRNELERLAEEARNGGDFLEMVSNTSEMQFQDQFMSRQQMAPELANALFGVPVGSIVGPIPSEVGYSLYKVLEERDGTEALSEASHILFRTDGGQDDAAQKAKAEDVLRQARGGANFTELAKKNSEEPGADERGGSLGWFGKGRMVPEFEAAVTKAKVGDIVGPVKTQFGYHVIKVTGRSSREVKFAEIRLSVKSSARTRDDVYERARNFAYMSSETSFDEEAATQKIPVLETPEFAQASGSYIPNIGVNPALMKFAFENGVGTLSEVYRATNGYVVAVVSEELPEGYRSIDEVKEQIKMSVVFERQLQKTLEYAGNMAKGKSLEQIAAENPTLPVQFTNMFTPSAGPTGLGRDETFIGTILRMKQGETSAPFRTMRGVYMLRVENKSNFDETAYTVRRDELRTQNLQQMQNEFIQSWLEKMREKIDIVDNRDRFYR